MTAADRPSVTDEGATVIEGAAHVIAAETDEPMWSAVVIAKRMASRGLLATTRTRPARDDLARAIASGYEPDHPTPNRHDYRAADAVLELFRGGDK